MLIMITNHCHMGCPHCMQDSGPDGKYMTGATFRQVKAFVQEAGPKVVLVTGGEPTEHPYWAEMTKELLAVRGVEMAMILTNGEWIEDSEERIRMARLIRSSKGRVKVQVYSHPKYYRRHEWTVAHEQQYRSIGCTPDFDSPLFMQDLGRARQNCPEEVLACTHSPSCVNSHLLALQTHSLLMFSIIAERTGKFCRPLIDPDGGIHMSESWLCPEVAHVSDGAPVAFVKMKASRPCRGCRLYKNFQEQHPAEAALLEKTI
jgi:organic radical activating enzyme